MQNNTAEQFDISHLEELRQKSCARNSSFRDRIIAGTHEKTHYSEEDSSVFLWINQGEL